MDAIKQRGASSTILETGAGKPSQTQDLSERLVDSINIDASPSTTFGTGAGKASQTRDTTGVLSSASSRGDPLAGRVSHSTSSGRAQ